MDNYSDFYTWKEFVREGVIRHSDGGLSCVVALDGFDTTFMSPDMKLGVSNKVRGVLHSISDSHPDVYLEFHLFREKDESAITAYLELDSKMIRGKDFARHIRSEIADNMRKVARSNKIYVVVSLRPFRAKSHKVNKLINRLESAVSAVCNHLDGARLASSTTYINLITQSFDRQSHINGRPIVDPRFDLAEQLIHSCPSTEDGFTVLNGVPSRTGIFYHYPNAEGCWFERLSELPLDYHASLTCVPKNTRKIISDLDESLLGRDAVEKNAKKGDRYESQSTNVMKRFAANVVDNDLRIYDSVFTITIHGDPDKGIESNKQQINSIFDMLAGRLKANKVELKFDEAFQHHFLRIGCPGMGHASSWLREDASDILSAIAPVIAWDEGMEKGSGEILRLSSSNQPVTMSKIASPVVHSFTIADTGSGKGTAKVAEIIETYPFGLDWVIIDNGETYKDAVLALGGDYIALGTDTTINPLPSKSDHTSEDISIAASALMDILFEGESNDKLRTTLAETLLTGLYGSWGENRDPLLSDLLSFARSHTPINDLESKLLTTLIQRLEIFLKSPVGKSFDSESNVSFSSPLVCVDFKNLNSNKSLYAQMLKFASIKACQHAFSDSSRKTMVLFDELHKHIEIAADIVNVTCRLVSRMGRKGNGFLDLITQGIAEIDMLDSEVLNGSRIRNYLYRDCDWEVIADRMDLNRVAAHVWANYPSPLNAKNPLPYRQGITSVHGTLYDLHLAFPKDLLDIATTSPDDLKLKNDFCYSEFPDDWRARLEAFQYYKSRNKTVLTQFSAKEA